MMLSNFISGLTIGFSLSILTGPLLFTILQSTIEYGRSAGFQVTFGIWFSDLLIALASYYAIAFLENFLHPNQPWESFMGIMGSTLMLTIGFALMLTTPPAIENRKNSAAWDSAKWKFLLTGFLVNTLNPFTFTFWIGIMGASRAQTLQANPVAQAAGIIVALIITDSLKVLAAAHMTGWLNKKAVTGLRKLSALAFLLFGFLLLIRTLLPA